MATATRTTKSLSLEKGLLREVERTRGGVSTSERVNELLKTALEVERNRRLAAESEAFFSGATDADEASRKAFQAAAIESLARED
jgi:metal-responsive CopG/Arc/MetJ family transcriptional regulator